LICAHDDQTHNCTIGWGYLLHKGPCTTTDHAIRWSRAKAERKLRERLANDDEPRVRALSNRVGFNQCQFDALMSFASNASTARWRQLTAGLSGDPNSMDGFAFQVPLRLARFVKSYDPVKERWKTLPVLVRRRAEEAKQFQTTPCPCPGTAF
jgi:GH24 family phage-related lysozyme (muramidase)